MPYSTRLSVLASQKDATAMETETNNGLDQQQHQKRQKAAADDLICPITQELPFEPVTAEDGRLYERSAIEEHIAQTKKRKDVLKSPITNEPMGPRLFDSPQIKSLIETLVENRSITGDLADAWKKKEKEKKGADELLKKAQDGDAASMHLVYVYSSEGTRGFKKDCKLASQWLKKAHAAGSVKATAALGNWSILGWHDVPKNIADGLVLTTMAAKDGSDLAAFRLGRAMAEGKHGLSVNKAEAIVWLQKSLDKNKCHFHHLAESAREKARTLLEELTADAEDSDGQE